MRTLLSVLAAALLLATTSAAGADDKKAPPAKKKRLLVITESKGFVHDVVNRKGQPLCLVEKVLTELGDKTGDWETVCSQDSRSAITAENLANFDAVFFYTTGELPLSETQKSDLLQFVRSGKGFAGSHSATDTFYKWPEYGNLIGAYFDGHPWHTKITVVVEDPKNPATRHLGEHFEITDEIYQFRTPYDRKDLHVLMRMEPKWATEQRLKELKDIDTAKKELPAKLAKLEADGKTEDAKKLKAQVEGRKPGIHRADDDHALAWTKEYGKGRVFYTALGHRDEVWKDERFQKLMIGGLRYVLRLEDADASPSGPLPPK
jgi:uncharacterized protein